ncbi:hypothetical protein [Sorangium sp. So ce124]|uniref:hypothetical protein n=1 Tax=Sorangium sp. So ce124 TaxID=3133280 RepID=UPI003F63F4EB
MHNRDRVVHRFIGHRRRRGHVRQRGHLRRRGRWSERLLTTASWLGNGSGFVFVGTIDVPANDTTVATSALLVYDMATAMISPLVLAEPGTYIDSATIAPDATSLVYCLRHDDVTDLHAIDLTQAEPEDRPITTDGKSCYPAF